jgi:FkbM family methyltransferase
MKKPNSDTSHQRNAYDNGVFNVLESAESLLSISKNSIRAVHSHREVYSPIKHPYFGYYTVNLFNCPKFMMYTNNDCPRAMDILFRRFFEPMSMHLWCELAKTAAVAVDIGAHVGVYSLAAASLRSGLPILAIEPNPDVFSRLKLHCELNKFKNITPFRLGIADRTAFASLKWRKKPGGFLSSGSSFVVNAPDSEFISEAKIQVTSLDEITKNIQINKPVLIKIDVEGAEALVIKSMPQLLKNKPDIIIETFIDSRAAQISEIMNKYNYAYFLIDEKTMTITRQKSLLALDPKGLNFNQLMTTRPDQILKIFKEHCKD